MSRVVSFLSNLFFLKPHVETGTIGFLITTNGKEKTPKAHSPALRSGKRALSESLGSIDPGFPALFSYCFSESPSLGNPYAMRPLIRPDHITTWKVPVRLQWHLLSGPRLCNHFGRQRNGI